MAQQRWIAYLAIFCLGTCTLVVMSRTKGRWAEALDQGVGAVRMEAGLLEPIPRIQRSRFAAPDVAVEPPAHAAAEPSAPATRAFPGEDPAGVTSEQRLEYLTNSYAFMHQTCANSQIGRAPKLAAQKMFLYRCLGTWMHAQGRVAFPDELTEAEAKRYSARPAATYVDPDRFVFYQDGAWFEFFRGEYPAFDRALELLTLDETSLLSLAPGGEIEEFYEQALATLQPPSPAEGEK